MRLRKNRSRKCCVNTVSSLTHRWRTGRYFVLRRESINDGSELTVAPGRGVLTQRAQRIRDLVGTARTCIIEVGRELLAARREMHGELAWERWLEAEFSWSERQAAKYVTVATAFD